MEKAGYIQEDCRCCQQAPDVEDKQSPYLDGNRYCENVQLIALTVSYTGKGEELYPKLDDSLKEKDWAVAELQKIQGEIKSLGDARPTLNGEKLQI